MSLSGVVVVCHSRIGHKGGFIKGMTVIDRGRKGQSSSPRTDRDVRRDERERRSEPGRDESHPVMNRRVLRLPECRIASVDHHVSKVRSIRGVVHPYYDIR